MLIDKSKNKTDVPLDYVEFVNAVQTRFLKTENLHMPNGKFALSGFRVFGNASGDEPEQVKGFNVLRTEKDKRSAWLKWYPVDKAYAYNIYFGIEPDKLYNCIMVYNSNEYWLKAMDSEKSYFFVIEALNECGTGERSQVVRAD